jgi:hypothetical protein
VVRPPWPTSDATFSPIRSLGTKTPKSVGDFRERVLQLRRRHRLILGDRSLYSGTLPGRGSAPEAISINAIASAAVSIDFTAISTNLTVSYDEEGVVLDGFIA